MWIRRKKTKKNGPRNIFQSIFRHTALHPWLHLSRIFYLRYTALSFAATLWLSKSQRCFPAVLPTNANCLVNWVSCLASMLGASVVELLGKWPPFHVTGQPGSRAVVQMDLHDVQKASQPSRQHFIVYQPFFSMNVSCLWTIVFLTERIVKPRFKKI